KSPDELRTAKRALVGAERYPSGAFKKQYRAATTDRDRLAVVRRFLGIAPHDVRLRSRLLALLESLGMKQELPEEVRRIRIDPFADAALLAQGASALKRLGDQEGALRVFGELIERAPNDAWARAFVGDRLRDEGLYDDAARAYGVLEELLPDEPATALRLALAHAGAGRLDIATRMLARVAQTGGRAGDAKLGELSARVASLLLTQAVARPGLDAGEIDRLTRTALELPQPSGPVVLLRSPSIPAGLTATVVRGPANARDKREPDVAAPALGLYAFRLDAAEGENVVIRLHRREELTPTSNVRVRVEALSPEARGKLPRLLSTEIDVPPSGKTVEVKWSGGTLSSTP